VKNKTKQNKTKQNKIPNSSLSLTLPVCPNNCHTLETEQEHLNKDIYLGKKNHVV
jgi:hypothetical protein